MKDKNPQSKNRRVKPCGEKHGAKLRGDKQRLMALRKSGNKQSSIAINSAEWR